MTHLEGRHALGWGLKAALFASALSACNWGRAPREPDPRDAHVALLPDVRIAKDRPPVVLVSREGDPAGSVGVAVTTSGLAASGATDTRDDDPEAAVALAGVVEARLAARGLDVRVVPSWNALRATVLATTPAEARIATDALREALLARVAETDLPAARRKLAALAVRPLRDAALTRWARCAGAPYAPAAPAAPARTKTDSSDALTAARVEAWRAAAFGLGRVAFAFTGPLPGGEAVASAIADGPAWRRGATLPAVDARAAFDADVFESAEATHAATIYATLDLPTSSAAVETAEALGDAQSPLAARLAELDLPFRLREIVGAAHPNGGCVAVTLESSSSATTLAGADLAARVADAIALVRVEAEMHLEGGARRDGRTLARRAGDARDASERAAWWALADAPDAAPRVRTTAAGGAGRTPSGSVTLAVPGRRGKPAAGNTPVEPTREALALAIDRSAQAWQKPVVEGRSRVEPGQGEAWVLVASPCGTDAESDVDAGMTALFVTAAAEGAKSSPDAQIEPWIVADGAGLLVHGPALAGESPTAHARRLSNIAARAFAAEPLAVSSLSRARAELLRHDTRSDGNAMGALASALAPQHPSWVVATGLGEALTRSADAAVLARAQALRSGPMRVAVLANADASQADAAVRAADRWAQRRTTDSGTRTCRALPAAAPPRAGTFAAPPRHGALPEAYVAFPFAPGDDSARASAEVVAAALDADGGLLEKALGGKASLARAWDAQVVGYPRAPALVVRLESPQATLDDAVMQTRALVERIQKGTLPAGEIERALATASKLATAASLDPRARVVQTWRGDAARRAKVTADEVRAFAQKTLAEDGMIVVAARPGRAPASSSGSGAATSTSTANGSKGP